MRTLLFMFCCFSAMMLAGQAVEKHHLVKSHVLYSRILNEERFFDVYTPPGQLPQNKRVEVLYILDGSAHFTTVMDILQQLTQITGDSSFAQTVVVGIGNIWERDRDYTPTQISSSPFVDDVAAKKSGGGERFISFLQQELIPYVDSLFSTTQTRIILGHSLGGLMVIHMMINHTSLFSKYVAIDPSMWWDDQKLLKQAKGQLVNKKFETSSLFLAVANTRNKDIDDPGMLRADISQQTALNRPSVLLADYINDTKKNKLTFDWKYYKDEDHMSVFRSATYDALQFLQQSTTNKPR